MTHLTTLLLAALLSFPRYHLDKETEEERKGRLTVVAEAVDTAAARATCFNQGDDCKVIFEGKREDLALLIIAVGFWESRFARHIHEGKCRTRIGECDFGKSKTMWQFQRLSFVTKEDWKKVEGTSRESTELAAWIAAQAISAAHKRCQTIEGTFSAYAGVSSCSWSGAKRRFEFYEKLRSWAKDDKK